MSFVPSDKPETSFYYDLRFFFFTTESQSSLSFSYLCSLRLCGFLSAKAQSTLLMYKNYKNPIDKDY